MGATIYDLPRSARISRLRTAAKDVLQEYGIRPVKTRFISSAFPVFRVEGRPYTGGKIREYMLKFKRGINAASVVPKVKIPRAVWVARRFVQGVKFLDI
jgi:hypothetical protein